METRFNIAERISTCAAISLLLACFTPARAHNGPPFPIIENRKVGPCIISLWTHPDVGTGTFFVIVDPLPGGRIPDGLSVQIGITPESGRLPEVIYTAAREDSRQPIEYKAFSEFDRDEFWRVRLILQSAEGSGEAISRVEATPPGYGRWDLLLYLLPFLAVAFLWVWGITRRRRSMNKNRRVQVA